jgi:3-oxoacyl-[acyl-carrier protein] reductase
MEIALVTGGSSGIGKAIVAQFINENKFVFFTYNSNIEEANKIVNLHGVDKCSAIKCSVENHIEIDKVVNQILNEKKKIDILVNNAGINYDAPFLLMNMEKFISTMNINFFGAVYFSKLVIKNMISNKKGSIINISSISSFIANQGQTNYASSKAALNIFSKSLAKEVGNFNIRVNCIAPGITRTNIYEKLPVEVKKNLTRNIPLKRIAEPSEIANLVSFLASDLSSYITGSVITIDGGAT